MENLNAIIFRIKQSWGLSFGFLLTLYFVFYAFNGTHSVKDLPRLDEQKAQLISIKSYTFAQREKLSQKVSQLHSNKIDPDLLEENVRQKLGYVHPDEVVIYTK